MSDNTHMHMQCVVIDKNGKASKPPNYTIPFNDNSTRALSKKNRVYVLREFLHRNYPSCMTPGCTILDVAGGRGDLSWILQNIDGINSIIADPRVPNHRRLVKSVEFLLDHPEEAKIRSVEGLPTHQPLAKLLPRLLAKHGVSSESDGFAGAISDNQGVDLISPNYMRMHVDNCLVETLRQVLFTSEEEAGSNAWDSYWENEQCTIEANKIHYGGTAPKTTTAYRNNKENSQIRNSQSALKAFRSLDLIVGFHPDQATEATIDLALLLGVPFAVVPCCVFPSEFPSRFYNGKRVKTHAEFVEYLCTKHGKIRRETLSFVETETAKNVVLYA